MLVSIAPLFSLIPTLLLPHLVSRTVPVGLSFLLCTRTGDAPQRPTDFLNATTIIPQPRRPLGLDEVKTPLPIPLLQQLLDGWPKHSPRYMLRSRLHNSSSGTQITDTDQDNQRKGKREPDAACCQCASASLCAGTDVLGQRQQRWRRGRVCGNKDGHPSMRSSNGGRQEH